MKAERFRQLLPALWAGLLLTVALIAAPAPFATLATQDAGRVVARVFAQEAWRHALFGLLLGTLEHALNDRSADEPPPIPVSSNGHGDLESAAVAVTPSAT